MSRVRHPLLERLARQAVEVQPSNLTDMQWNRVYMSVFRQLATDEAFRSDAAADIAETFTLEDYEEWFQGVAT